jgi:large subunit ribosomal protein L3
MTILGYKVGMSSVIDKSGNFLPVTLLYVPTNYISQIKTEESDGYKAIQLTTSDWKEKRCNQPLLGHFRSKNIRPGYLKEFRIEKTVNYFKVGDQITTSFFTIGDKVDVTATSKGKGFQGVIRRHGFKRQGASHGNTKSHRTHGSTGSHSDPSRVFPGKKMAGHLGHIQCTIHNLVVLDIRDNLLVIKGAIPGPKKGLVSVQHTVRNK